MNIYSFTGHLGRDSEVRHTQSGTAICSFSVAVSFGYGDNTGTNWIRCSLFGKRAEGKLPQHLVTGQKVAISGELKVREYDDREGVKKTSVEVNVNSLDLMGNRQEGSGQQSQSSNKSSDTFKDSPPSGDFPDDDIPF